MTPCEAFPGMNEWMKKSLLVLIKLQLETRNKKSAALFLISCSVKYLGVKFDMNRSNRFHNDLLNCGAWVEKMKMIMNYDRNLFM